MAETDPQDQQQDTAPDPAVEEAGKGKAFFDRADEIASTGEWDYAIEMYVEGLKREPSNIERGHKPLREVSLRRKLQGAKGPGFKEKRKYGSSKDPKENLANASFLLAKDPGNRQYMVAALKAALDLDRDSLITWFADLLYEEQKQAKKPSRQVLMTIIDAYVQAEKFTKAVGVCQFGLADSPGDNVLIERVKDLSAKATMQKYSGEGDITTKVKDKKQLEEDIQRSHMVQSKTFLENQLEKAEAEYKADPTVPGKVTAYVEALMRMDDPSYENTAIDVLRRAHNETGSYNWKMRIGDIKMKQMTRRRRELLKRGDKKAALEEAKRQLAFELEEFQERVVNYPTDLALKYELGRRQFAAAAFDSSKLDDAIGSLQQARRDPRRRIDAMTLMAQAFAKKEWYTEAADTYRQLLEGELTEEHGKSIRYSLGEALMQMEKPDEAEDQFSQVAQIDYNFKDVRKKLEVLRNRDKGQAHSDSE